MLYAAMAILAGYQAVVFSLFTKIFAIPQGLLPEDPRLNRLFRYVTLESGLAAGLILLILSAAGSFYALNFWRSTAFGELYQTKMLRLVIPSAFAFLLGCQNSFFQPVSERAWIARPRSAEGLNAAPTCRPRGGSLPASGGRGLP